MEPESFFPGVRIFSMIHADVRRDALERWLAPHLRGASFTLTAASEDASFRRYWRATLEDGATYVVMDAPPDKEDCRPFVRVARMLADAGVHAPRSWRRTWSRAFCCFPTSASAPIWAELNADNAVALFADATDALLRWQLATRPDELPPYDEALLRREMNLFPEWYVAKHLGLKLNEKQSQVLEETFRLLVQSALAQPVGLRAPRLHAAQPDGVRPEPRRARLPGRGARADHLRHGVPHARCVHQLGRRARARLERALLGEGQARGPAGRGGLRRVLARVRVDGTAAPPQGARHLRAHQLPRRQAAVPRGHAALREVCKGRRAGAIPPSRPLARLLDELA